jgi:tellurite resistance protein
VLVADGIMTDDEQAFLQATIARLGLSDAERAQVTALEGIEEAKATLRALPTGERELMMDLLVDAASSDGRLGPHELAAVRGLADDLGL